MITLKNNHVSCSFDESNGTLREITKGGKTLSFDGVAFDFGCDGKNQAGYLEYESMLEFRTWNLPVITPTRHGGLPTPDSCVMKDDAVTVTYDMGCAYVSLIYELDNDVLMLRSVIENKSDKPLYLNTFSFITRLGAIKDVTFDFPGNVPIQYCKPCELEPYKVVQTGLVSFATHTRLGGTDFNLLFIDPIEKWSNGVYRDETCTNYAYNAGLEVDLAPRNDINEGCEADLAQRNDTNEGCEANLAPMSRVEVGTVYFQLTDEGNPYTEIRKLVDRLGYLPCEGGITGGVMYSCHPSGTMDARFPLKDDLYKYAEYLPVLKSMGIDHVWLLPVFEHDENGVYHSNDQSIIDTRYGGEEGCKYYCDKAHELGMTVLFDYVPHGPAPEFPIARDNPEWPSKRRDGSLQDEWKCVSMDYNHPGYIEYTSELVHDHVRRFGVDGARIDCAMGGLSNWRPYKGERPSGNSVRAGVHITEAIRDGFLRGGKQSFILPENFYPIPNYYHCTDVFYGMNLYRVFCEIESLLVEDPAKYVGILTDFLERESLVTPSNYHKMRFLGNHDTVSWVWQSRRARDCYGLEAAKALWAVISLIDGMPMIYQGDEDPSIYKREGENLIPFFTELFKARRKYLPEDSDEVNRTTYLHTGSPVMAFIRHGSRAESLVAVNVSVEGQVFELEGYEGTTCLNAEVEDGVLKPYAYYIFKV